VANILVIDDEPLVALVIRRTLEDAHQVTVQSSARAALALIEQGSRFDAILTDLHMPEGDGVWLRAQLERIDRTLSGRMLFLTGGAAQGHEREFLGRPGVHWLAKPFRAAELLARVEKILSGP
jgi:CheY-like chemotaxis protein